MSKVAKKSTKKASAKEPVAFSKKEENIPSPSDLNPSKFAPSGDVDMSNAGISPKDGLYKLFKDSIKDIYWAENQLVKALPKMAKAASSESLSTAILNHLEQTKNHVARLEEVFLLLGEKVQAQKCDAMEGLTKEGEAVIENTEAGTPARDLGIIMASQKVEHYEMAAYTGLIKLSGKLGYTEVADILTQTLTEEQQSDETLADIAEADILLDV